MPSVLAFRQTATFCQEINHDEVRRGRCLVFRRSGSLLGHGRGPLRVPKELQSIIVLCAGADVLRTSPHMRRPEWDGPRRPGGSRRCRSSGTDGRHFER
jgi:hypothetical protein